MEIVMSEAVKKTGLKLFSGKPGPGRPPGVPNKATSAIKDMVIKALDKAGGVDYLVAQAKDNPGPFMTLVGKVIPLQIAGDPNNPIGLTIGTPAEWASKLKTETLRDLASVAEVREE